MRRSDDDDLRAARVQGRDVYAEVVNGYVDNVQARRASSPYGLTGLGASVAGVLEGGAPDADLG